MLIHAEFKVKKLPAVATPHLLEITAKSLYRMQIKELLMEKNPETTHDRVNVIMKILPILAFLIPMVILYSLDPASFEATWKGRTFYIFFVWLASLEIILGWETLVPRVRKLASLRSAVFIVALLLPTVYVIVSSYGGLNAVIEEWAHANNVGWYNWMPLSMEYLAFAVLFALLIWSEYGFAGLKDSAISSLFLVTIGMVYTIDNLYPDASFTPFQALVPATSTLAANFLNLMGYRTSFLPTQIPGAPCLQVQSGAVSTAMNIAWPCSGVESLLIYTVTILLFLRRSPITWRRRTAYFAIGGIVTYFINILRIATLFMIQLNTGGGYVLTAEAKAFHDYYGQLYSITWIISYPLIIMGSQLLLSKVRSWRVGRNLGVPNDLHSVTA
jgi:exosortase/archaeosortase family protein